VEEPIDEKLNNYICNYLSLKSNLVTDRIDSKLRSHTHATWWTKI